ncbi:SRPBCC family protein [Kribbella deserti]|uniref:SRPBCC family protein n=1 Tax=Kribbella deserti TaxID=1926257 RepID=A0ABV6QNP1_9ACTN
MSTSRHVSVFIGRSAKDVYAYAADPAKLPEWAAGLSGSIEQVDGVWIAESPMGKVVVKFAESNEYGVLDHEVTLPSGEVVYNPMRVIPDGTGCEVVFTIRRRSDMTDDDLTRDADAVQADLLVLKNLLEGEDRPSTP